MKNSKQDEAKELCSVGIFGDKLRVMVQREGSMWNFWIEDSDGVVLAYVTKTGVLRLTPLTPFERGKK